jgi:hypothetical protein
VGSKAKNPQKGREHLVPLSREVWAITSDGTVIDYFRQPTDDLVARERKLKDLSLSLKNGI